MTRLILVNGAPGLGKSTLARRWADAHPMTLCLDIDTVRSLIGGWQDDRGEAGRLARLAAIEAARIHLAGGRDVIVPQYLGRIEFVETLDRLAGEVRVRFVEVVLVADLEDVVRRFERRAEQPETPEQAAAAAGFGTDDLIAELRGARDRIEAVVAARPRTIRVRSREGELDATYAQLRKAIEGAGPA